MELVHLGHAGVVVGGATVEVVGHLRAVAPPLAVPIHEAVLANPERRDGTFRNLAPQGTEAGWLSPCE